MNKAVRDILVLAIGIGLGILLGGYLLENLIAHQIEDYLHRPNATPVVATEQQKVTADDCGPGYWRYVGEQICRK